MKREPPTGFLAPDDVADADRATIAAVVSGDGPFVPESRLKGHDLVALEVAGWLVSWARDAADRAFKDPLWTLSPWGAYCLDLVLVEYRDLGEPVWSYLGDEPSFLKARRTPGEKLLRHPELIRDPLPGPEQAMLDNEPLMLFRHGTQDTAIPVLIDRRLKGKKKPRRAKAKGKAKP